MRDYARLCEIKANICEPRKRLRSTFLCEVCDLACEKECDDVSASLSMKQMILVCNSETKKDDDSLRMQDL